MSEIERPQSRGEEIANSISHGAGLALALAAMPFLILQASRHGGGRLAGAVVFAAALVLLYLASTLYHALPQGRAKRVFQVIEHGAIFLMIAGTYTPFTLGVLRGPLGWTLLAAVWALAAVGIGLKVVAGAEGYPVLSMVLYLGMGWLAIAAIQPLWQLLPRPGFFSVVLGGVSYTAGVPFYLSSRLRFGHFVWHLFVLAGSAAHTFAVLHYAV